MGALNQQDAGGGSPKGPSPLRFVGVGAEMVAPLVVGALGGHWLDRRFGTEPWLLLVLTVLGAAAGMFNLIRRGLPPGGVGTGRS